MWLLTINAGSSSLKLTLCEEGELTRQTAFLVERIGSTGTRLLITGSGGTTKRRVEAKDHVGAIDEMFHHLPELFASGLRAVGHRNRLTMHFYGKCAAAFSPTDVRVCI